MATMSPAAGAALSTPRRGTAPAFAVLVLLLLALQFGPLVGLLGFNLTDDPQWALSGALRDAAVAVLVLLAAGASLSSDGGHWTASTRWAVAMVLVYSVLSLASSPGLFVLALNLRRLVLVPLLFAAVAVIPWTPRQYDRLFALIVSTSIVVVLFGLAERFSPDSFWTDTMQIERYTAANGFDPFGTQSFQQSGRFFSGDLLAWTKEPVRRLISSYLEPTTLAAGMAALLVVGLARLARGHAGIAVAVLAALAGVLTLSKGFWAFLLLLACWRVGGWPSPRQPLLLAGLVMLAALLLAGRGLEEGAFAHLVGTQTGLKYLMDGHLFGEGIGEAGNYTNAETDVGTESGLGSAIAQTGIAAVLPLLWLQAVARDTLRQAAALRDPGGPWIAMWTLFWLVTYIFSASSQGVGGNALGFVVMALYINPSAHGRAA